MCVCVCECVCEREREREREKRERERERERESDVGQVPEFSEVFRCPVGSPMHPAARCSVW